MLRVVLALSAVAAFGTSANAQVPTNPSIASVVASCAQADATCSDAVTAFGSALTAANVTGDQYNQAMADLVVALAREAADDGVCDDSDALFGQAISYVASTARDATQAQQITDIGSAVAQCQEVLTAALAPGDIAESASGN